MSTGQHKKTLKTIGLLMAATLAGSSSLAFAGPREQAVRMHNRLVGTPPSAATLAQMEGMIGNDPVGAAMIAIDNPNNTNFYNTTLRNFAAPLTNVGQSVYVPLNDMTATVIGMVRDDRDFREVLYGDYLYTGGNAVATGYSPYDNVHYEELDNDGIDLKAALVSIPQTVAHSDDLAAGGAAGVQTTRAASEAYFSAGTNRRMLRGVFMGFLCRDFEDVHDVTRVPDRVRQDISRSPGGDSSLYLGSCIGCHAGMDGLAGAYAYYQHDDVDDDTPPDFGLEYTVNNVQGKNLINAGTFPSGYETVNDTWVNYWRNGPNSAMGWDVNGLGTGVLPGSGNGAASLGQELANTRSFSECQSERVFQAVCLHEPATPADRMAVQSMATSFQNGYSMKRLFAETAAYCMGQ